VRRLTSAPLPEWGDLFAAVLKFFVPEGPLAAPWCRPVDEGFWFSRSAWSMAAVARWRKELLPDEGVTVWIPDFFCNASLAPLRDMGARLVFYPVTDQMAPDLCACNDLARAQRPDIVVLVHYFGQPTLAEPISAFCQTHGAWLIEDATHVLRPVPGVGEVGDCVLYSPHKHLPIPDGAVLVVRPDGPARLAEQVQAMSVLRQISARILDSAGSASRTAALWLVKRTLQRLGLRSRRSVTVFNAEADPVVPGMVHPRMSTLAKRLLARLGDRLDAVARLREQRAQDWRDVLSWADPASAMDSFPVENTPYLASFVSGQEADARALFDRLQRAGIPAVTWPDLPPEVMNCAEAHRSAIALRHNRIYLPVHQTVDPIQILACGRSLLELTTTQWQARVLSREEWDGYWQRCPRANLLQSWQYGAAKEEAEGWKASRFLISDELACPIALAQVLTRGLPLLGAIARLNRGPLLLADLSGDAEIPFKLAALQVLLREGRRRRWLMMQTAPELPPTNGARTGLQALGFNGLTASAWGSGRMALDVDEQALLMSLKGKWRNCLRKGEKLGVVVTHHVCRGDQLDLLVQSYTELQSDRGFHGLSENLIRALAAQQGAMWQFNLFTARENDAAADDEPLGVLVTIRSGDTAIYLIGSTNEKGRQMQANSVLLWQAILHAKRHGCAWFDIGGLSEATPKGIAEFKQGLNAKPYELVGEWRKW